MSTPGGMSLGSRCGIQTHDDFNQAACYSILSQIGIPGVWFQVVFEIARRCGKQFPEKVGKNLECISVPVNIVLLGFWVRLKPTSQLECDDILFVPPTVSGLWCNQYEVHPLDRTLPVVFRIREMDLDPVNLSFLPTQLGRFSQNKLIFV